MLSIGRTANFSSGEGTKTFRFYTAVEEGDPVRRLDFSILTGTNSALFCLGPHGRMACNITNKNGVHARLNMTHVPSISTNVTIDARRPRVIAVYTNKTSSAYDGVYTVGETIPVVVRFHYPVTVIGTPKLLLATGDVKRSAIYSKADSTNTDLVFIYSVQDGDFATNLAWVDRHSLLVGGADTGSILRESTKPKLEANVTLPWPRPLARQGQQVQINTIDVPHVVNLTCRNVTGSYGAGDSVLIDVFFSKTVVVTGVPFINMDLTDYYRRAMYVEGSGSHILSFRYTVQPGDHSGDLSYVDHHSLERGNDVNGRFGTIRQISMKPTTNALLALPFPGEAGSLSHTSDIVIDGTRPYITHMDFKQPDGLYTVGSTITLLVRFTAPVAISGQPGVLLETGKV